jgi:hypothetical protein
MGRPELDHLHVVVEVPCLDEASWRPRRRELAGVLAELLRRQAFSVRTMLADTTVPPRNGPLFQGGLLGESVPRI